MNDFVVVEGHTHKLTIDSNGKIEHYHPEGHGDEHAGEAHGNLSPENEGVHFVAGGGDEHESSDAHGKAGERGEPIPFNQVVFQADEIVVDLENFYGPIIHDLMQQAKKQGREIKLTEDWIGRRSYKEDDKVVATKGEQLTIGLLKKLRSIHLDAKANNSKIRTKQNIDAWGRLRESLPKDKKNAPSFRIKEQLEPNPEFDEFIVNITSSVSFEMTPAGTFLLKPRDVKESPESVKMKDGTTLNGHLDSLHSQIEMAADAIDFRHVAMRAEEANIDPKVAILDTWIIQNNPEVKALWEKHCEKIDALAIELDKKGKKPTETERYRMGWQDLVNLGLDKEEMGVFDGFTGPNHKKKYADHFPELKLPREEVRLESMFTPRWNNYYAIYFLITGLHGLHVIGGIIVLGYFLFFGKKMYLNNPERLANRVEVCGLFWHFVDLVWIFLFPILYLM